MAEAINRNLEEVGFKNLGIEERPGLVILRRTKAPALLVETGFINTDADNELFDTRFNEIAQAIANGILEVLNDAPNNNEMVYTVQTGAFRNQEYAQDMLYQLQQQGYPAFLVEDGGFYKVRVGTFRNLDNAIKMEAQLRRQGYSTFIVHE